MNRGSSLVLRKKIIAKIRRLMLLELLDVKIPCFFRVWASRQGLDLYFPVLILWNRKHEYLRFSQNNLGPAGIRKFYLYRLFALASWSDSNAPKSGALPLKRIPRSIPASISLDQGASLRKSVSRRLQ